MIHAVISKVNLKGNTHMWQGNIYLDDTCRFKTEISESKVEVLDWIDDLFLNLNPNAKNLKDLLPISLEV